MINKERLINTFLELVKIDSISGEEENIIDHIYNRTLSLDNSRLSSSKDSYGNLIVKYNNDSAHSLLLAAHADTVEPGRGINPVIINNVIKSSGNTILGADNKAAVAVLIELMDCLAGSSKTTGPNVEFVFTRSEEVGNYGALNLDYSLLESKYGFSFDLAAPIGNIVYGSPFYNAIDLKVLGKYSHASRPEQGINVLKVLTEALNHIKLGNVNENTICNIGVITGGSVRNSVPGELFIKAEVRSFIEQDLEATTASFTQSFENAAQFYGASIESTVMRENNGFLLEENDSLISETRKKLKNLGIESNLIKSWACFDANIFVEKGIKVLNLADGSKYSHTFDEEISVENLFLLANTALNLLEITLE